MSLALLFCQCTSFSKVIVECNFAELLDLLNSDRRTEFCSLEAAWIIEDICLIRDSFYFISFDSILLRCNRIALARASATKEDETIVQLEKCHFFLFSNVQHDFLKKTLLSFPLKNK